MEARAAAAQLMIAAVAMNGYTMSNAHRMHSMDLAQQWRSDASGREKRKWDEISSHTSRHTKMSHVYMFPHFAQNSLALVDWGFFRFVRFFFGCELKISSSMTNGWATWDQNKATDISRNTHMISTMWRFAFVFISFQQIQPYGWRVSKIFRSTTTAAAAPTYKDESYMRMMCTKYHVQIALFVWQICLFEFSASLSIDLSAECVRLFLIHISATLKTATPRTAKINNQTQRREKCQAAVCRRHSSSFLTFV